MRKRLRWLAFTGSVGEWLDAHIVAGLAVPWLGASEAGWRFDGLIGLGYSARSDGDLEKVDQIYVTTSYRF